MKSTYLQHIKQYDTTMIYWKIKLWYILNQK